jgi:hypothetical protein
MKTCRKCKETKENSEFRHGRYDCKVCERLKAREWYHSHKTTVSKVCRQCGDTSTNFQTGKAICRKCAALNRKDYNLSRRTGLSKGMIAMWKAGFEYEDACKMIKNNRNYKQ